MKILLVGSDKIFAIENFYVKYLKHLREDISTYTAHSYFIDYYKGFVDKVVFKLGISSIYHSINRGLIREVEKVDPQIVWIFKGMEIFPSTLTWIKARGIKLVNYNPDNPFIFSGAGSGNKNITQGLRLYDLYMTYNTPVHDKLIHEYLIPSFVLPFGYDVNDELLETCAEQAEIMEACFLGNPDTERASFVNGLAATGVSIAVYGHDWQKFANHSRINIFDAVYGEEQWKVLRRYRVQLNLMRGHNLMSHNMRTFEVPGIGGILVAPDTPDHRQFFTHGKEAFFFQSVHDCAAIIQTLLAMPKQEAEAIRENALQRCVMSGYSYKARALAVQNVFKTLVNDG